MHFLTILSLTLASLVLNVSCASLAGTPVSPSRRFHYMAPRTLQDPAPDTKEGLVSRNELNKRQCPGGENCIDGGCCPSGYQCDGAFTANSGCCPLGHTCTGPPVGCADPSLFNCPGVDACCTTAAQCPNNNQQSCNDTPSPTTHTLPTTKYTPPTTQVASVAGVQPTVTVIRSEGKAVRVMMGGVMAVMMGSLAFLM